MEGSRERACSPEAQVHSGERKQMWVKLFKKKRKREETAGERGGRENKREGKDKKVVNRKKTENMEQNKS